MWGVLWSGHSRPSRNWMTCMVLGVSQQNWRRVTICLCPKWQTQICLACWKLRRSGQSCVLQCKFLPRGDTCSCNQFVSRLWTQTSYREIVYFVDVLCLICLNGWLLNVANVYEFWQDCGIVNNSIRSLYEFFQVALLKYPGNTLLLLFVIESFTGLQVMQWDENWSLSLSEMELEY